MAAAVTAVADVVAVAAVEVVVADAAVAAVEIRDRVGLGWRPELAAATLGHLGAVDVVEVIADDWFGASARHLRALRTLASQVPVLHGVGLGLASCQPVATSRLEAMARVVDAARPEFWSEHLAFVRAGGYEIGHLAAPPRSADTVDGTAANVDHAHRVVGSAPLLENIATLVEPPGRHHSEAEWVAAALEASATAMLLDLHNLHANATNFGFDPLAFLDRLPAERLRAIHLAGGRWITPPDGRARVLDDHLHDVPEPVFALLEEVAVRAPRSLTVILERDGHYPPFAVLQHQMDAARRALAAGRRRRADREAAA
jgi:uncharacterized protein